jgi:hypothetical protein
MGLKQNFKKKLKDIQQDRAERQIFLRQVRKKTLKAQRETYEQESIRQSKKQGKRLAKEKYTQKKGGTVSQKVQRQTKKLIAPTKGRRPLNIRDIL